MQGHIKAGSLTLSAHKDPPEPHIKAGSRTLSAHKGPLSLKMLDIQLDRAAPNCDWLIGTLCH